MKITVFGSSGFLGSRLANKLEQLGHLVFRQSRASNSTGKYGFDLKEDQLIEHIQNSKPDVVVNCAALTNVSLCQESWGAALAGNTFPLLEISKCRNKLGFFPRFIHFSTDHLYDASLPAVECDVNPKNNYALSKLFGDLLVSDFATVIRTNFVGRGSLQRKTYTDWIYETYSKKEPVQLFTDVYFNPVHVDDLVDLTVQMLPQKIHGIFNFGSDTVVSKASFHSSICEKFSGGKLIAEYVRYHDSVLKGIPKPSNMGMNTDKARKFGFAVPTTDSVIEKTSREYMI